MRTKKKYPKIEPKFVKNKAGRIVEVYLDYDVYLSIFEEIDDIKKKIKVLKKKKA